MPPRGEPRSGTTGSVGPPTDPAYAPSEVGGAAQLLAVAAATVVGRWRFAEHGAVAPPDVRRSITIVCEAIGRALAGEHPSVAGLPTFVSAARVLELLRSAFIEHAREVEGEGDARAVVRTLWAMERVHAVIEDDAAHRLASRLSGSEAQQLVVEMAHDMRSPLGSILILAERLRHNSNTNLTPIQERQLGLIYSAAFGLSSLAGDVIELARGGTTLLDQPPMPFSVSDVLQSILDILRPMAEEKNIAMRCIGPEADVRVGFQAALNRVLLNLATNALKFTNEGSVEVSCRQLDRTRIEFSVRDTGRGIPPHVLANLFEAFRQRQHPGSFAFSSAGLGLSICKKLIAAMGGELKVDTELEKGTRFYFELELPQSARL